MELHFHHLADQRVSYCDTKTEPLPFSPCTATGFAWNVRLLKCKENTNLSSNVEVVGFQLQNTYPCGWPIL